MSAIRFSFPPFRLCFGAWSIFVGLVCGLLLFVAASAARCSEPEYFAVQLASAATRAAIRLAGLGRSAKIMIGGVTGWLDEGFGADAIVHLGKHGTLEWLPGKAVGPSAACYPDAALGDVPFFYHFVVNDPGDYYKFLPNHFAGIGFRFER